MQQSKKNSTVRYVVKLAKLEKNELQSLVSEAKKQANRSRRKGAPIITKSSIIFRVLKAGLEQLLVE